MSEYLSDRERQERRDAEYREAWKALTAAERGRMAAAGIAGPDCGTEKAAEQGRMVVGREDDAGSMAADSLGMSYVPEMASLVDRLPQVLEEEFDLTAAQAAGVAKFVEGRVREATMQTHSLMLSRIVGFFLAGSENLQARAHGLAHAARMGPLNGLRSLRHSAKVCQVSPEWIRRVAWRWCDLLDLPPLEGAKSEAAKQAYSDDKKNNHWRNKTCKADSPLTGPTRTTTNGQAVHGKKEGGR